MIKGIGIDSVEVARMEKNLENTRFLERVFTPAERELIGADGHSAERASGNFAVKEAVGKALGCGMAGCPLDCVETLRDEQGAPVIRVRGKAEERFAALGVRNAWVSITHTAGLATAFVVLEGD